MSTLTSGARLGAFEVLEKLGEGGMGAVYRARDTRLHREVAIKVLLPAIAGDPDRLARFEREAQVLASLNHSNIASIYGIESTAGSTALVLELVEGQTLADRIAGGPLPLDEALAIAAQIADALAAAHDQGIVHRDLKPANVKLRPDGTVKVLDFGLAKAMGPAAAHGTAPGVTMAATISATATVGGMILGTAAYMSPEQASGQDVDKRADIWAFGVVLWEMLAGRRMFEGETISHVLAAVLTKDPDLSAVPPRVGRLLAKCLERDPRKRLRDIGDAMSLVADHAIVRSDRSAQRWPGVVAWTVAAGLAVALALVIWARPSGSVDDAGRPAVRLPITRSSVDPYNNAAAAFALSPDGRYLAYYTSDRDGRATLSVQTLATGERREIPGSGVLSPQTPFWSFDSRQVVHAATLTTSVFDVVTATTRELCSCRFRGGSWNREGVILLGSVPNETQPIRRVTLQDRIPAAVTASDAANGERDTAPMFLPDAERFVFTRLQQGGAAATYVGSLRGGEVTRIADGSRGVVVGAPGQPSYLVGVDAGGFVAQPLDLDTMTTTGDPVLVIAGAAAAAVSDNGVLATSAPAGQPVTAPAWFDRTGKQVGAVGSPGPIQSVALASDGRQVALAEALAAGDRHVWVKDDAGHSRRVTPDGGDGLVWSPDGTRLALSIRVNGVPTLHERAADGSGRQTLLLSTARSAFANDWSRDGRWVIFTQPKADSPSDLDLWVVRADAGADRVPVPFVTSADREAQAEFSPDGRFVAYTSMRGGEPEVYVQPFPDAAGGKWLVASGGAEPHWSRDGKELFFIAGQTMMAVPVSLKPTFSSGTPRRLFDAAVQPWYVNDSDRSQVAPDGRRFLLLIAAGETPAPPIDVVVNWTTLLQQPQ